LSGTALGPQISLFSPLEKVWAPITAYLHENLRAMGTNSFC
jgi:hypothetical protein